MRALLIALLSVTVLVSNDTSYSAIVPPGVVTVEGAETWGVLPDTYDGPVSFQTVHVDGWARRVYLDGELIEARWAVFAPVVTQ